MAFIEVVLLWLGAGLRSVPFVVMMRSVVVSCCGGFEEFCAGVDGAVA